MSIDSIGALGAVTMPDLMSPAAMGEAPGVFDALIGSLDALNERLVAGGEATRALALGETDNLHQLMIAGEQTRLAFDLMMQVRNKVLDAYQEIMRLQV